MEEIIKTIEGIIKSIQDIRNLVDRLFSPTLRNPGHIHSYPVGEISYFSTTGTAITITGTSDGSTNMVLCNPATTFNSMSMGFTNPSNGRLQYIGTQRRFFHSACSISYAPEGANDTFVFGVAKNGTVLASSKLLTKVINAGDTRSTAIHVYTHLDPNDYLELYVGNTSDADDVTIKTINLFAMGMDD